MNKWGTSTYRYFVLGCSAEINTEKNKVNHFYTSRGQHLVLNRFKASKPTSCSMSQVTAEIQSWMCMQDFFVPSAWKESEPAIRSNQPKHDLTWWQRQAVSRPEILANHTHVGNYFICTFSYTYCVSVQEPEIKLETSKCLHTDLFRYHIFYFDG